MARVVSSFSEMSDEVLECRAWRHAWVHKVTWLDKKGRVAVVEMHLECNRCPTTRVDVLRRSNAELLSRAYHHPDDYLIKDPKAWGGRKVFNTNVRMELITRRSWGAKTKPKKKGG